MALEETAERGGIGITKVVTYLQYGQIRTGRKQILRLLSQILLNIIAGGNTHHLLDNYGQKWRVTSTYDDVTGKVVEEVEYNDRNRPVRIRKYEWNADGTKAKQYNYLPNGKLYSVKVYEYIFSDK